MEHSRMQCGYKIGLPLRQLLMHVLNSAFAAASSAAMMEFTVSMQKLKSTKHHNGGIYTSPPPPPPPSPPPPPRPQSKYGSHDVGSHISTCPVGSTRLAGLFVT